MTLALVAILAVQGAVLRRRLNSPLLSPLTIVVAAFAGMGVLGAKVYRAVQYAPFGGSIRIILDDELTRRTVELFLLASVSLLLGGGAVLLLAPKQLSRVRVRWRITLPANLRIPTLVLTMLPMSAVWLAVGPANLMWRGRYLEAHVASSPLLSLAVPLSLAACLVVGSLLTSGSKPVAAGAVLVALGYELTYFAVGSRVFALVPFLAAVGAFLGSARRNRWGLLIGAVMSGLLLPVPLYLRAQTSHGVWPYLAAMQQYDLQVVGLDSMLRNVFISFGLVGATAFTVGAMPWETFAISINPLPGSMVGWYEIAGAERLNIYTPYAAMGEVGNRGMLTVVAFYAAVGVILGILELRVRAHLRGGRALFALTPAALAALYVLSSYQYNLRTSCRVLLYAVLVELLLSAVSLVRSRRTDEEPDPGPRIRPVVIDLTGPLARSGD